MTLWDRLVTASLLALAVLALIFQGFIISDSRGESVIITVNGREYAAYSFSEIDERKTIEINTEYGSNTVEIDRDGAWVSQADCPDKQDIKAGKINKTNQLIVCLPNRLMIEIRGGERKVDKVTY